MECPECRGTGIAGGCNCWECGGQDCWRCDATGYIEEKKKEKKKRCLSSVGRAPHL